MQLWCISQGIKSLYLKLTLECLANAYWYEMGYLHNCFNEVSTRQCAMAIASFDISFPSGLVFVKDSIASC